MDKEESMEKVYEVLDSITKRLGNPFLISFALSWLITNWKIVLVILSSDAYTTKFKFIESLYCAGTDPWWRLAWWPLIAASIYVFFIPFLATIATGTSALYDNLNELVRAKALKLRVLTLDDSRALEARLQETVDTFKAQSDAQAIARLAERNAATSSFNALFHKIIPLTFSQVQKEAGTWPEPRQKLPPGRRINGPTDQDELLREIGLPSEWLEIFKPEHEVHSLSVKRAAAIYRVEEDIALDWLLRLTSLGMTNISWAGQQLMFTLSDIDWAASLRGRPIS